MTKSYDVSKLLRAMRDTECQLPSMCREHAADGCPLDEIMFAWMDSGWSLNPWETYIYPLLSVLRDLAFDSLEGEPVLEIYGIYVRDTHTLSLGSMLREWAEAGYPGAPEEVTP